ncbi:MAG: carboxymuconolactone decarboxylase family protein [Hyphomicrobiaceae bacterium]|nr:carboxymuconolactone decarboxylase family protein [Hyphomicrobiaceae bacterium]
MSRINTLSSIEAAPAEARPLLQSAKQSLGIVPNLFRVIANSPAALQGYFGLNGALTNGSLDAKTRERIAVAVAEVNGCSYCLSAHTYLAKNVAKLDDGEITANRNGASNDLKADAAVRLAVQIVRERGHVSDAVIAAVRDAGYDDAQIVEIVLHVALNTLTNYVNEVAQTAIDFPKIETTPAHAA